MVNNMREQLVKAGYAQNSRPNMQKKGQQFDFDNLAHCIMKLHT